MNSWLAKEQREVRRVTIMLRDRNILKRGKRDRWEERKGLVSHQVGEEEVHGHELRMTKEMFEFRRGDAFALRGGVRGE
jgi:hypothetical protein